MKKVLLSMFAVSLGLATFAQGNAQTPSYKKEPVTLKDADGTNDAKFGSAPFKATPIASSSSARTAPVSVINIGNMANAYSIAFGQRQGIAVSPATNSVVMIHRATTATQSPAGPGSGVIWYDYSTDGGATWNINKGPLYSGTQGSPARYPRGGIYNPTGNTSAANVYVTSIAPSLPGTNGSWGGQVKASAKLDGSALASKEDSSQNFQIPDSYITAGNKAFLLDGYGDIGAANHNDTSIVYTGTWNVATNKYDWTSKIIRMVTVTHSAAGKAGIADGMIAFDNNAMVGYIVQLTHIDVTDTTSTYVPVVLKTTDGGVTWGAPYSINIQSIARAAFNNPTANYSTAFEVSAQVDTMGNLHIGVQIGGASATAFSVVTAVGNSGTFHIVTNGTSVVSSKLVGTPRSLRGVVGSGATTLNQDLRTCVSRTASGKHIFIGWFETDTILSSSNTLPDFWAVGYNVVTGKYSNNKVTQQTSFGMNLTQNTLAEGLILFGSMGNRVFEKTDPLGRKEFELPVTFMQLDSTNNVGNMTKLKYLRGAIIKETDFFALGANDLVNDMFTVNSVYPNPFKGSANLELNMKQDGNVTFKMINNIGQVVKTSNFKNLPAGKNILTIDGTNLSTGLYFYTVESKGFKSTGKLVVE